LVESAPQCAVRLGRGIAHTLSPDGKWVAYQAPVASRQETVGPQSINHSGQLPSVSVSFGLRPGVSLGAAVERRLGG
jgi:HAE1 family hydrophobic/amphiphilic exporter-1